ncbi:MAG: hydantoinase B/oxoprolinase family protein [Candidatus Binatia bacterium]|nr:hydantoinase B/oxoprolinase family protein [Candidatus Binatia bacterium]
MDPVQLEIFSNRMSAIAEEMGILLCRTAYSPNITERRDCSCAVFDGNGEMIAQAAHIPVHLGSTPLSVKAAIERTRMEPGDVVILNDPFAGGTHLPDITMVAPVFVGGSRCPIAFVANRAHHSDVGGMSPASIPLSTDIFQEGIRIPPVKLVRRGEVDRDIFNFLLNNVRTRKEREGDLRAQWGSLRVGATRILEEAKHRGMRRFAGEMKGLIDYSERLMAATIRGIPDGLYRGKDVMDDDGMGKEKIRLCVQVRIKGARAVVDFTATDLQVEGCLNANYAITLSCVFYVFKTISDLSIPANGGIMRPIRLVAPEGSLVNARFPAAIVGGNVETSQRIVDVLFLALARALPDRIPAASTGSMNNTAVGGYDPIRGKAFSYYETVGGGAGGGSKGPGASGVHTHMTNTMNTPIEALENSYPFRVRAYSVRRGSGGKGKNPGGDGLVREIEFLADSRCTLLTERRLTAPYGLKGGGRGRKGRNLLIRNGRTVALPGKANLHLKAGERIRMETTGGGGWGTKRKSR